MSMLQNGLERDMTTRTKTLTIRPATADEVWAVRKLFTGLHDFNAELDPRFQLSGNWERYLDEHLRLEWNGARSKTLVAWEGEQPIGLLMLAGYSDSPLFRYRHWAEILALYIDPNVRGGMLAYRFIKMAKRWAAENGYDRIQLYVTASNDRAKRFYEKVGFTSVQEIWRMEIDDCPQRENGEDDDFGYGPDHDPLTPRPHNIASDKDP
jgi:ribosomal protein S18 acetylase RimI-like enzyme